MTGDDVSDDLGDDDDECTMYVDDDDVHLALCTGQVQVVRSVRQVRYDVTDD